MWVALGRRFGKSHPVAFGSLLLGIGTSAVYPMLPAESIVMPLVVSSIGLGSLLGCIVLIDSLVTDVIDFDTVQSRARRSGVYFGVWRFCAKLARGTAIGGTGLMLDLVGFVPYQQQTDGVRTAIAWLFGPGVGVWFVAAAFVLLRYRFDDSKQAQVQRILRRREQQLLP
jgi:GPH family glycoside/pentoside/hexuronide:cation symporter